MGADIHKTGSVFSPNKLNKHPRILDYQKRWLEGDFEGLLKTYPITLEIGPSGPKNCPHKCNFCMHGQYYDMAATMSTDMYHKLVDEVTSSEDPNQRSKSIIFSASGESTVNPHIVDFINYAKANGLESALVTNGWGWINREKRSGLVDAVLDNVTWTRTSLDAGTSETRYKVHGVRDYEQVMEGLSYLADQKKQKGSKCHIGAQIVVTEDNVNEILLAARDVKKTGIDYLQIKPVIHHPLGGKEQLPASFWNNVLSISEAAKKMYEDEKFRVFVKDDQLREMMLPNYGRTYGKCGTLFLPIIEADGTVFHCSQTRGMSEFELGNLKENTFKEIWEGEKRRQVVEGIDATKCQEVCRGHWYNLIMDNLKRTGDAPNFI